MDEIGVESALFVQGVADAVGWRLSREDARADTEDDFDDRFDTVVPIEVVTLLEDGGVGIVPDTMMTQGMHVWSAGSFVGWRDLILQAGTRLRSVDLAVGMLGGRTLINVSGPLYAAYFILDWCVSALVSTFLGFEPPLRKTV